jgi:hypothetical protein
MRNMFYLWGGGWAWSYICIHEYLIISICIYVNIIHNIAMI